MRWEGTRENYVAVPVWPVWLILTAGAFHIPSQSLSPPAERRDGNQLKATAAEPGAAATCGKRCSCNGSYASKQMKFCPPVSALFAPSILYSRDSSLQWNVSSGALVQAAWAKEQPSPDATSMTAPSYLLSGSRSPAIRDILRNFPSMLTVLTHTQTFIPHLADQISKWISIDQPRVNTCAFVVMGSKLGSFVLSSY